MGQYVVYTDESGVFKGSADLRVVAAVVLAGERSQHEIEIGALLDQHCPWTGPFHCIDCTTPWELLARLRDTRNIESELLVRGFPVSTELRAAIASPHPPRSLLSSPSLEREIRSLGARLIASVRRAMLAHLLASDGCVVVCLENLAPTRDRWLDMLHTAVREALLRIAMKAGGPHRVDVLPAERGAPTTLDLASILRSLARAHGVEELLSVPQAPSTQPMRGVRGIQAADVFAHLTGPRAARAPSPAGYRLERWMNDIRSAAGATLGRVHPTGAAIGVHGEVVGAVGDMDRDRPPPERRSAVLLRKKRAQDLRGALPQGTYLCSIEATVGLLGQLSERL